MMFKQKNYVSAVVYVRNDANEIGNFLDMLYGVLNDNFESFEIICVNDASIDQSKEIIKKLINKFDKCKLSIVNMSYFSGREAAMHAGVDFAIGDFVFEFDSILINYEPNLILDVYNRSLEGFDIVSCGTSNTRIFSRLFYAIYNINTDSRSRLRNETFRILSRRAINRIHSMSLTIPYRKALYLNSGLEMDHIKYKPTKKGLNYGSSLKSSQDTALTTLILYTDVAYKITMFFAILMATLMLGFGIFTVYTYIVLDISELGWAPIMGILSAGFCGVFLVLTIAIKYLDVLLKNSINKQAYLVSSIDK